MVDSASSAPSERAMIASEATTIDSASASERASIARRSSRAANPDWKIDEQQQGNEHGGSDQPTGPD